MRRRQHANESFDSVPPSSTPPQYGPLSHPHHPQPQAHGQRPHHPSHSHGHGPTQPQTTPLQIPQSTHPFPTVSPMSSSPTHTHGSHMPSFPLSASASSDLPTPTSANPNAQQPPGKRGFFSRPRWFNRDKTTSLSSLSASASSSPTGLSPSKQLPGPSPPRASFSLGFRRTTVSTSSSVSAGAAAAAGGGGLAPPGIHANASRSLLDVSSSAAGGGTGLPTVPGSPQPSPPRSRGSSHRLPVGGELEHGGDSDGAGGGGGAGAGDLRSVSSKPWSRSMDDFSRFLSGGKGKNTHDEREKGEREREKPKRELEKDRKEREKISAYRERGYAHAPPSPSPSHAMGASVSTPAMFGAAPGGPVTPPIPVGGPPRLATPQPVSPLGSPGLLIPGSSPSSLSTSPKRSMDNTAALSSGNAGAGAGAAGGGGDYMSLPRARHASPARSPGSLSAQSVPFPLADSPSHTHSHGLAGAAGQSTSSLHLPRLGKQGRSISESRVSTLSALSGGSPREREKGDRSGSGRPSEDLPPVPPLPASVSSQPGGGWFASGKASASNNAAGGGGISWAREGSREGGGGGGGRGNREATVPSGRWEHAIPVPPVPSLPRDIARSTSPLKKEKEKEKEKEKDPELPPFLALLSPTVDSALAQYAVNAAKQRNTLFPAPSGSGLMPEEKKGVGKGDWRVYKASLKGSKVLFYKVPNDRQPAVEAHFPRTLVPIDEKPSPPLQPPPGSAGPSPSAGKQRKRVYWGKGRHPDWRRSPGADEEAGEDAWEGTGEAVAHECVFRSFLAERKRDTVGSLAQAVLAIGLEPHEIPLPDDAPEDFPENGAVVKDKDRFVLSAMTVLPVLWGKEFWAEIEKRVESTEEGREREEAVKRLRTAMLDVWGREMCEVLEVDDGFVPEQPRSVLSDTVEQKLRTGLDVKTFLSLPAELVARSLKAYYGQRFPSPFTPSSLLSADMDPWMHAIAPEDGDEPLEPLTRLVMLHILVESRTGQERKAAVKAWADVLRAGPGYAAAEAIRRAFSSAPVARLEGLGEAMQNVVFAPDDGSGVWRGGRKELRKLLEGVRKEESRWSVLEMKRVWDLLYAKWQAWTREEDAELGEDGDIGALVQLWEDTGDAKDSTYQTIASFLAPSLAAQPKQFTRITEHFWAPRPSHITTTFLLSPLHFPEGSFPTQAAEEDTELVRLMDGELLVRLLPARITSTQQPVTRPPSLNLPSNFAIPSSPPASKADHRSSAVTTLSRTTTLSRRSSMPPPALPLQRAVLVGATLERLIDLLIIGEDLELELPAVRDDLVIVGKKERVLIDVEDARRIFWHWRKSWISGPDLFDRLKRRYDSPMPSAALNWPRGLLVPRVRFGVLQAIEDWLTIGDGAQEAREDAALAKKIINFLAVDPNDSDNVALKHSVVRRCWDKAIRTPFAATDRVQRPIGTGDGALGSETPDLSSIRAEALIDQLDDIAAQQFAGLTRQDLLAVADLFEVQLADRLAFFQTRDAAIPVIDDVPIQNINSFLTITDAAAALSPSSLTLLSHLLPDRVRLVLCAQYTIQKWLASKVAEPGLGAVARQQRISLLLRAMDICRNRMGMSGPARMRSFVEAAIANALLTPESRSFTRAWQGVAQIRGVPVDTLNSLLSSSPQPALRAQAPPLAVDLGWILERMIEILSSSNTSTFGKKSSPLLNLKKRRRLDELFSDAMTTVSPLRGPTHDLSADSRRLANMEKECEGWPPRDIRQVKDEAWREQQQGMSLSKAQSRMKPFARTVALQIDKLKRDRQIRDRLARDIRADKERVEKMEAESSRVSTQPKKQAKGGHKKGRSVTAFFRVVRPLSTVFGADKQPELNFTDKTLPELDFSATSKPALSLSLVHATVRSLPNEGRSFTFAVETEDGGKYVLQAPNPADREQWMKAIARAAQVSAARRSQLEASTPKLDLQNSDWQARPASQHPKSVYGVTLTTVLERDGAKLTDRGIPLIISQLIDEVERRGLTESGIYRISGSRSDIEHIRNSIDKGLPFDMVVNEYTDIYAICDAIKQWFRDLPESILPVTQLKEFEQAIKIEDYNTRMFRIQDLVLGLPRPNFLCLRGLAEHLNKVTDFEERNHMHAENLAMVWAPTLCRPPANAPQAAHLHMFTALGPATAIVKQCIVQYHWLFNEPDEPEPESAADTELQTPTGDSPTVEERRFSMTVTEEGAVVIQEEPVERPSMESKASGSSMGMPNIDVTGPTPEPSVDSHGDHSAEDGYSLTSPSYYAKAASSTSVATTRTTGYP